MAEISFTTPISGLVTAVQAGSISSHDLVEASLAKIEATSDYHAILEINPAALDQAAAIDARIKAGEDLPLAVFLSSPKTISSPSIRTLPLHPIF
jgi:Asp-tRNA(Asn)/Glu-tRNA(Gln) amidotransferase A subunit family amidase